MNGFTRKELIKSLVCPCLTVLWAVVYILNTLSWGGSFSGVGIHRMTYFFAIPIGGILPVILTLALNIHTEQYLTKRLFVIAFTVVAFSFIGHIGTDVIMLIFILIFGVGAVIFQVLKVHTEDTTARERVALILGDPIIYYTIDFAILYAAHALG